MNHFYIIYNYIFHFFSARHTRGFSVHSPFIFKFTHFVLLEKHPFYVFQSIENLRTKLKSDKRILNIKDFGTGDDRSETVSNIAKRSLKSAKYGQLLFRMVHYFKARNILELGTSLGITTSYLASSSSQIHCVSIEGCPQIAETARENIDKLGIKNIELVEGNINSVLVDVLKRINKLDFVFIDANHQSEAILSYFDLCLSRLSTNSVMVIDDIHWSRDMEMAWTKIKNNPQVKSTIDLFQLGIVFFNTDLHKSHYKMRY